MDCNEAIERILKIVPMLRRDVKTAILSHEVMEAQNAIVPPGLKGYQADFVQTYEAIQNSLVLKLAMDVARVFDCSAGRPLDRQDMASIPVLAMLLEVPGVVDELANRALDWFSGLESADSDMLDQPLKVEATVLEMLQDERAVNEKSCRLTLAEFRTLVDRLSNPSMAESAALSRLKVFRNQRMAHSLFNKEPDVYPKYADLTLLLDTAKVAAELSSLAVEGLNVDFTECTLRSRRNAEGYAAVVLEALQRSAV